MLSAAADINSPRKGDQDRLDACLCLLAGLHFVEEDSTMVGNLESGYMVVPTSAVLISELSERCRRTNRESACWIRAADKETA